MRMIGLFAVVSILSSAACALGSDAAAGSREHDEDRPVVAPVPESDAVDLLFLGSRRPYLLRVHLRVDGRGFRRVWKRQAKRAFDKLDLNGDGLLDVNEAQRIDAQNLIPEKSFLDKLLSIGREERPRLPADGGTADGKVTRAEFVAYLQKRSFGAFETTMNTNPNRNVYNPNGNKLEAASLLNGLLDRDGDKRITPDEVDAAAELLRSLDADDDELVSLTELQAAAMRNPDAVRSGYDTGQDNRQRFLSIEADEDAADLANRALRNYPTRSMPAGDDSEVGASAVVRHFSREQMEWAEAAFATFDADGNGELDAAEYTKYLQTGPPALELIVRRGEKSGGEQRIEIVQSQAALAPSLTVSRLGRDVVSIDFGLDRLEVDAAGSGTGDGTASIYEQQFAALDSDNNDYLEKKDVARNYYFENSFKLMDADGDGKLFKKEMQSWLERQTESAYSRTLLSIADRGRNLWDVIDRDHDRRISLRELRGIGPRTTAFDADSDKAIESKELPRNFELMFGQGRPRIQGVALAAASISVDPSERNMSRDAPLWFKKMDINNDGDISPREFLGPREHFGRLDADGDGLIDPTEAQRFD